MGKPHAKQPGLAPELPRKDKNEEEQRLEAIAIVTKYRFKIFREAHIHKVSPVAIAGAILWEGIEDPDSRFFPRALHYGPGHVHTLWKSREHLFSSDIAAQKVEAEGRVTPPASGRLDRFKRVQQPQWAITYIAAIMAHHAHNYKKFSEVHIAGVDFPGVDIRDNVGVLCTLYQGGNSEERAKILAIKRQSNPAAQPVPGDQMGPWVVKWSGWIHQVLNRSFQLHQPGDYPNLPKSTRVV